MRLLPLTIFLLLSACSCHGYGYCPVVFPGTDR